jgi:hypothetical protein
LGNESLNQLKGGFPMDRITGQLVRVGDCSGSPFAGCFDAGTFGVGGGEIFGLDCLHSLKGINCPQNPPLPMGSPGNSSLGFDEVTFSGSVGRNPHRLNPVS